MNTQTVDTNKKQATPPRGELKKRNIPIIKLDVEGDSLEGKFLKRREHKDFMDKATGEMKDLYYLIFEKDNGDKFQICENAGLKNAFATCDVMEGDYVKVVFLGKKDLSGGRSVNTYDIFVA